jgi:hypothetical protein
MRRLLATLAVAAVLAGCSPDPPAAEPSPEPRATTGTSPSPEPVRYDEAGCPVLDEAFCATATAVVEALQAGDAGRLLELSRRGRLVCADLAVEYFPACDTDDVLVGYGLSGATFLVEVVDAEAYRGRLETFTANVDPAFSDELGDGAPRVIGVGTCGPDIPGRRTYHLAWTAAASEDGAPAERVLGSFELTFEDDAWAIALWYLGSLEEWEAEQPDPLDLAFCEAGLTPWPPA